MFGLFTFWERHCANISPNSNLYWIDLDVSDSKPSGRILTSLLDGRYKRTLVKTGLERPTSLVLNPANG